MWIVEELAQENIFENELAENIKAHAKNDSHGTFLKCTSKIKKSYVDDICYTAEFSTLCKAILIKHVFFEYLNPFDALGYNLNKKLAKKFSEDQNN